MISSLPYVIVSTVTWGNLYHLKKIEFHFQINLTNKIQWRSQNAKKVTHIKGRLLDQAVILHNCVPF